MVTIPSPIERIDQPLFQEKGLDIWVKRDDLIHPLIMGNKWRKLKYNLLAAQKKGYRGILTFGGAYSNHIAATAAACKEFGIKSMGIIRGQELTPESNPTLRFAALQGMDLKFVSRADYRVLKKNSDGLIKEHPHLMCVPEGGTNDAAIQGCMEIVSELDRPWDYIITSIGTGGTMAGLLKAMQGKGVILGISALKGDFIHDEFKRLTERHSIPFTNYVIHTDFHFGGYGKVNDQLIDFINKVKTEQHIPLDPIYTGKMYFGMNALITNNYFPKDSKILILHTGGLQGIEGFNEKSSKTLLH